MEEILKMIEDELVAIKNEKEELTELETESKNAQDEFKQAQEETKKVEDKESGFYKDLADREKEAERNFREIDIKRMNKDTSINYLISIKKDNIIKKIEEKKQYIDDNRNVDISEFKENYEALKEESEKLKKEIELNDTPRDKFDDLSDADKQAVRKAKERYLINKHRLDEINPKIELIETLDGKSPLDRYMEFNKLLKTVEDKFNRENFENLLEDIENNKDEELNENLENNGVDEKLEDKDENEKIDNQNLNNKSENENIKENAENKSEKNEKVNTENANEKNENTNQRNENDNIDLDKLGQKIINQETKNNQHKNTNTNAKQKNVGKNKIILSVTENVIEVNGNRKMFYKNAAKNKKELLKDSHLAIKSYFINDKKAMKNIDYALLSTLKNINDKLALEYLNVIRGGGITGTVENSLKILNNTTEIMYKFDKESGIFSDLKPKRLARNAFELGIAGLEGINAKGFFETMISKIKSTKLLNGHKQLKQLNSGEKTRAQNEKQKTIDLINQDRKAYGLRDQIKVDNKDNKIEKAAQKREQHKNEEYSKLTNSEYLKSIDKIFDEALEEKYNDEK